MGNSSLRRLRRSDIDHSQSVQGFYRYLGSDSSIQSLCVGNNGSSNNSSSGLSRNRSTRNQSFQSHNSEGWPLSVLETSFLPVFPVRSPTQKEFTIIEEIGKGSFGKVYKAQNDENGKIYALKTLSKSKLIKENAVQQVKEEVQIQKLCGHHRFIVDCPFHWQTKRHLHIVTEYIDGGELYDLLKAYHILPLSLVKLYVAQLAITLDFLHNAGVIFRDLKPENVLLESRGNIRLTDFGLSKWLKYGAKTRTVCGTLKYIAPEILEHQPYGHAADWWSLGVIACFMTTGQYPKRSADGKVTKLYLPTGIDASAKDLLVRLLTLNPGQRLRSLRTLKTIAFYKGYKMEEVMKELVSPKALLEEQYPDGPPAYQSSKSNEYELIDTSFVCTKM